MIKHDYCEINKIQRGPFKYVLSTGPIDFFYFTLTKEQLVENFKDETYGDDDQDYSYRLNGFDNVDSLENYITNIVASIEEEPHTIRYMCIPTPGNCACELVVIAKISNNGTCFIFSNNRKYLQMIKQN